MSDLTAQQEKIFLFIQKVIEESGIPPTRVEIARALGFRSANAAETHLRALQRKGVIELLPGASRGIQVRRREAVAEEDGLPLVGRVAAGHPILAEQHIEGHFRVDPSLFNPRPHYLLRVQGMSMKGAGILDGDLVAVCRTPEVRNGQIIVARLEDEVTVKRYRQTGATVWLYPENPDFVPIEVDPGEETLVIEGVVVGVIRHHVPSAGNADKSNSRRGRAS
jgi:repressor LexA